MGNAESTSLSDQAHGDLERLVVVADDATYAEHERTSAIVALLSQCTRLRYKANTHGETVKGDGWFERRKPVVLKAFGLCSKEKPGRSPLLVVVLRVLGEMLVSSGYVAHTCVCAEGKACNQWAAWNRLLLASGVA
jgi:hypothetical protein